MPTLGQALTQIREMEGRAAVYRAAVSHFRLRYISRDSADAAAQLKNSDGSPVAEVVIEAVANSLEQEAEDLEQAVRAAKATKVSDE